MHYRYPNNLEKTPLCSIMTNSGSDKGNHFWHNYTSLYTRLFETYESKPITLFELGLGTNNEKLASNMGSTGVPGASHRGWADYFVDAYIYGADIDERILFQDGRIDCRFHCDQRNPESVIKMWNQLAGVNFDIIIDDALHDYPANIVFYENSFHKLKTGGLYIIEDILVGQRDQFLWYFSENDSATLYELEIKDNPFDNRLLVVRKS